MELVCVAARHSDVPHFAALDDVVEGDHHLLHRVLVKVGDRKAVDLEDVDVVEAEAPERGVDGGEDVLAADAPAIDVAALVRVLDRRGVDGRVVGDDHGELGEDDEVLAREVELVDGLADETLRVAAAVRVCGVPGRDPELSRSQLCASRRKREDGERTS